MLLHSRCSVQLLDLNANIDSWIHEQGNPIRLTKHLEVNKGECLGIVISFEENPNPLNLLNLLNAIQGRIYWVVAANINITDEVGAHLHHFTKVPIITINGNI